MNLGRSGRNARLELPDGSSCAKLTRDVVSFLRTPQRQAAMPGAEGEHLHDLLRDQATRGDQVSRDVRSPDGGTGASSRGGQETAGARRRRTAADHQASDRAAAAAVLPV